MLAHDVVGEGKAESGALVGRFGREERVEYLIDDIGWYAASVVADADFDTVRRAPGGEGERGLVAVFPGAGEPGRASAPASAARRFSSVAWQALPTRFRKTRPMSCGMMSSAPTSGSKYSLTSRRKSESLARAL